MPKACAPSDSKRASSDLTMLRAELICINHERGVLLSPSSARCGKIENGWILVMGKLASSEDIQDGEGEVKIGTADRNRFIHGWRWRLGAGDDPRDQDTG